MKPQFEMKEIYSKEQSVEAYIAAFPEETQAKLYQMRAAIQAAAPEATEKISYQIPTFALRGNLVHYAAFKKHIGFYPGPSGIAAFKDELAAYACAKGSVQFPLNKPLPLNLVSRMVAFRVAEDLAKQKPAGAKQLKTCSKGHQFTKSSNCPVCPVCEQERKPAAGFLATLGAPARRALENKGITTPELLAQHTEQELLKLHGLGPSSLPKLKAVLAEAGLSFKV